MRKWCQMMSSPVTSSVSCSCFVKVTIMVGITHVSNESNNKLRHSWSTYLLIQNDVFFNADFQNYLRTQTGSTTTINVIICTVDYLLRLQVHWLQLVHHIQIENKGFKAMVGLVILRSHTYHKMSFSFKHYCILNCAIILLLKCVCSMVSKFL